MARSGFSSERMILEYFAQLYEYPGTRAGEPVAAR
jgi:hypothetical protein